VAAATLFAVLSIGSQHISLACDTCGGKKAKPAVLIPGLGSHHHPVSTQHPMAQRFFDQGLTLLYGFNHDEAIRSFKRAAEYDPKLAMAHWGIALCMGPNYNLPADPAKIKAADEAAQKARALAATATERERAYIEAVSKRYTSDPNADVAKLAVDYKNAMGEVYRRFPDDLDAATLYAESAMNLRPWALYDAEGNPAEGTPEIVGILESVLRRNPNHPGANHYYIHAVEASRQPERAIPSAQRLASLVPAAGHLVHMPAHIWIRIGEHEAAAKSNADAAKADRAYIKRSGATGIYPQMYYTHNLHFLAVAHAMQGRFADAKKAADQTVAHIRPYAKEMPMLEVFVPTDLLILIRFGRWDELLATSQPEAHLVATRALWHFGRGLAYAAKGNLASAEAERKEFEVTVARVKSDQLWGNSTAVGALAVARQLLEGRLARAKGDAAAAIAHYRKAVVAEDALRYSEPPDWYLTAREALGAALLKSGDYQEAERVFRADLQRNARSGRSLFGLRESLQAQGREDDARLIQQELDAAWKNADTPVSLEHL
jgi:tetratricopeptide (TPR) repeat protein